MTYYSSNRVNAQHLTNRKVEEVEDQVGFGIDYLAEHQATCFYSAYGGQEGLPNQTQMEDVEADSFVELPLDQH